MMLKNFSIKIKLIASFSLIVVLIAFLGFYSNYSLDTSMGGFKKFGNSSQESLIIENIEIKVLKIRNIVNKYLNRQSQKRIEEFTNLMNEENNLIKKVKRLSKDEKRLKNIKEIETLLSNYEKNFFKIVNAFKEIDIIKKDILTTNAKKMEKGYALLSKEFYERKQIDNTYNLYKTMKLLMSARMKLVQTINVNIKFYKVVDNSFSKLEVLLKNLEKNIDSNLKEDITIISIATNNYMKGVSKMHDLLLEKNSIVEELNKIELRITNIDTKLLSSVEKEQNIIKDKVSKLNETTKFFVTSIALIILLIAILLALFLPKDIIKLLEDFQIGLLNFFNFLNKESSQVKTMQLKGKNEIVLMAKVVNENIQKTKAFIEQDAIFIEDVKAVVKDVSKGNLNTKIKENPSSDSLKELKEIFNIMLQSTAENICEDLNKLNTALEKYSNLDFTYRIEKDKGNLSLGLNTLASIINEMLLENKKNGLTLDDSSSILLSNVEQLNNNSNNAAVALEETAAALEEITSNISNNTNNVIQMSQIANKLSTCANEGEELAIETTESMEKINEQVKAINEAIIVIDQIAFQTNILSLNAAVEAATAGEAGKGFAVVAQEVRNLASRSAQAAKEIKSIVENATLKADEGKTISIKMKDGYEDLNNYVIKTLEIIKNVESASKEQQVGIEQINDAVNSLDQQTQTTASIASQTYSIAEQTDKISKVILSKVEENKFLENI